jgi:hypothetical protein
MGKYCYGRQGLWILALLSAPAMGNLPLYVLGYLHLDGD